MSILVIGGTGMVGAETVRRLAGGGSEVRVMTRSPEAARERLPAGALAVAGDLAEPGSLAAALEGVQRLCLITPLDPDETEKGLAAVRAAQEAGIRRLVFMSIHRVEECPEAPHFRSKIEIQEAIAGSGIPFTFVKPSNFFQNDLRLRDAILGGVYPQPLGSVGLHRVDVRDIADALAAALTEEGHEGKSYPAVGPDALGGEAVAEVWSRRLGRSVRYAGDDLEAWAEAAGQAMPDWMVEDLRIMYRFFQEEGLLATEEDLERQAAILGHPPRSFEDFAAETAKAWA